MRASKDHITDSNSVDGHIIGRERPSTCHIEMSLLPRTGINSNQDEKGQLMRV